MALPDAVTMIMATLVTDSDIAPLVTHIVYEDAGDVEEIAIYGEVLPPRPLMNADEVNKPATALVIRSFPGTRETDGGLRKPRVLIRSYARDLADARELSALVDEVLHDQTFDILDSSDTMHRIEIEMASGPNTSIEVGTLFPFCDRIYTTAVM